MKTTIMFKGLVKLGVSPRELRTASALVAHLRECVAMGIGEAALIEKERVARMFIRRLTLAPI